MIYSPFIFRKNLCQALEWQAVERRYPTSKVRETQVRRQAGTERGHEGRQTETTTTEN